MLLLYQISTNQSLLHTENLRLFEFGVLDLRCNPWRPWNKTTVEARYAMLLEISMRGYDGKTHFQRCCHGLDWSYFVKPWQGRVSMALDIFEIYRLLLGGHLLLQLVQAFFPQSFSIGNYFWEVPCCRYDCHLCRPDQCLCEVPVVEEHWGNSTLSCSALLCSKK